MNWKALLAIPALFVVAPVLAVVAVVATLFIGVATGGGAAPSCAAPGSPSAGGPTAELVLAGTEDQKATAFMSWLMTNRFEALDGQPMNKEQAAGVAGNVMQESGFNPGAVNEIGASGLFQWLGGRRDGLMAFATSQGKPWDDPTVQMQWLAHELSTSHRSVADGMKTSAAKSPSGWAKFWDDEFEISGGDAIDRRMSNAETFYKLDVTGGAAGGGSCTPTGGPISGDAKALAQGLVDAMAAGRLQTYSDDEAAQIRNMANGTATADCRLDVGVLQIIAFTLQHFDTAKVSSLNRRCIGDYAGIGEESYHWKGQAVDFSSIGGIPSTGWDANSLALIKLLDPVMPNGKAGVGQYDCRARHGTSLTLANFVQFDDNCYHLHLEVRQPNSPLSFP